MIYNENAGIIYDTIYYGVIYFNKQSVIKKFKENEYNIDSAFTYFDEVKNSCPPLDDCLFPFFYYDAITLCYLTNHFITKFDFQKHKFKDFIIDTENIFKMDVIDYLFANLTKNEKDLIIKKDSATVKKAFKNLSYPLEMINQTMFLIYNFQYVCGLLVKTLMEVHKHIIVLHEKYRYKITQEIDETHSKENLISFKKLYCINENQLNKQFFSISFMNPFFVFFDKKEGYNEASFLLGYHYKGILESHCGKKDISLETALSVLGEPIRFNMVKNLKKHQILTISDMSRLLNISTSTAFKNVAILVNERIIIKSHIDGIKIYYKINKDYLTTMENLFNEFINEIKGVHK